MATVWMIQMPYEDRDLSSASRYGAIMPILDLKDRPSRFPAACLAKFREASRQMQDGDYIVWAGGDFYAGILCGIALREQPNLRVNWLRWERERDLDGQRKAGAGFYVPVEINMKGA